MTDWLDNIEKLKALQESGALTAAEFQAEKSRLLSSAQAGLSSGGVEAFDGKQMRASLVRTSNAIKVIAFLVWGLLLLCLLPLLVLIFSMNN